ncbi:MAG: ABC transporter permease, partial [Pseudomonas sp.]
GYCSVMFKPVSLFIGLRYTRTRKKSQIISFVSIISTLGITVGVLALIVVLSVINGSTSMMRNEALKSVPHASIAAVDGALPWQALRAAVRDHPQVLGAAPYLEGEGWLRYDGGGEFIQIRGVDPAFEGEVVQGSSATFEQYMQILDTVDNGIILGLRMASRLGVYLDDELTLMSLDSLIGRRLDEVMRFRVIGVADFGFYGNDNTVMIGLPAAQALFDTGGEADGRVRLRLRVDDVFNAGQIASSAVSDAAADLPAAVSVPLQTSSWSETQASLFDALRLEKTLTGFMLLMIVIIGAVNIVSTLVMVVADKSADIAILRTMGASRATIMTVFVTQGTTVGIFGTLLGALLGVLLSLNLTTVMRTF